MSWFKPIQDVAVGIAFTAIADVITPRNKALFIEIIETFDSSEMDHKTKIATVKDLWKRIRNGETSDKVATLDDTRL